MTIGIIDFRTERARHKRVLGREDVFRELERLLPRNGAASGFVLVKGTPGRGKSALLADYLTRLERDGERMPHHFLRRGKEDWDRPEAVIRNLAAQVERLFPEQADRDARPESRLREVLQRVSDEVLVPHRRGLTLVVDGLDEANSDPLGPNPLPRFLPHDLPERVQVLCASRPTYPHLSWLEYRERFRSINLDDARWSASNEAVVREYWTEAAPRFVPPLTPEFIGEAVRRAQGNVLHAQRLSQWLVNQPVELRRVELLPQGLEAFLASLWERIQMLPKEERTVAYEGLGLITVAREALPLSSLAAIAGWPAVDDGEQFLRATRPFLLEEPAHGSCERAWRPFHESFRAFITERLGIEGVRREHHRLAERLREGPVQVTGGDFRQRYALRHEVTHWLEAGVWDRARALCTDIGYLETKCRELGKEVGVTAVEEDLRLAAARAPEADRELLRGLHRAVQAESHWLRREPEALALLVYNRLLCSGWERAKIEEALRFPKGAPAFHLLHPVRMSGGEVRTLEGHTSRVKGCALTGDGRVVSASSDKTLKVWDLESGKILATLKGHESSVRACAVTGTGKVVSASKDGTLRVWDLKTGQTLLTLRGHQDGVNGCAVTADGRRAVSASDDKTLKVWDLGTGELLETFWGHEDAVKGCAVTGDGRRVVSASKDKTLKVWDLESGRILASLEGHEDWVQGCAVTADGRGVSASDDKTLRVWDLESGRLLLTLEGHTRRVYGCAVTADGRGVSVSADTTLKVWDLKTGQALATLEGHEGWTNGCAVTVDGRVVSASDDNTLKVWDLEAKRSRATLEGHENWVKGCAVTADGRRAVSASKDKTLKVWDLASGELLKTVQGHEGAVRDCAITRDGRVVSASKDKTLKVWDLESGRTLMNLVGHEEWVLGCAVTEDGQRAVSASKDGTLKAWDLNTGRTLATLIGHEGWVLGCAVTEDGLRAVSASSDKTLKVWDLETRRTVFTLEGHEGAVRDCAVSRDGRRVVSASVDKTLRVWSLETGKALVTLEGHEGAVKKCAVTRDGRRVVSASRDRTLKVWDIDSGKCLHTLYGNSSFECVAATQDTLCAGDSLGNVWLLEASLARPRPKPITPKTGSNMDLGVVIALQEEFRVFRGLVSPEGCHLVRDEETRQHDYAFAPPGSQHRCVVTCIGDMNPENAALRTERLIARWKPHTVVMLGIAAGIHKDVKVGDVIVASQVDSYLDSARAQPGTAPGSYELRFGGTAYRIGFKLLEDVRNLEFTQEKALQHWSEDCEGFLAEHLPVDERRRLVEQGLIRPAPQMLDAHLASGPVVAAAPEFIQLLHQRDRNIKALDMESAGLVAAASKRVEPKRTLVIRGISDKGDAHKGTLDAIQNGALRRYAMHNATRFLWLLLRTGVI